MNTTETDYWDAGLTAQQVEESRNIHGSNELTPPKRPALWKLYLEKFRDPVIRVLLVAAMLSFIVAFVEQDFAETIGIVCAILLATGIGFYFEYDAARKFDILNALGSESKIKTIREKAVREIPRKELVKGDVILLDTGEEIPADAELLKAEELQVNESALTGEPMVHKSTNPKDFDKNAPYPTNHLMRGTTIIEGNAVARITAVGDRTEIGQLAREASVQPGEQTPLNKQLNKLAGLINKIGYTVAILTFLIFTTRDLFHFIPEVTVWRQMDYLHVFKLVLNNFMMAVTLIVMAVPEGLPMAITLSLALNMRRMLQTNNLVRKMHACETMGAVTTICTDKTGTQAQDCTRAVQTGGLTLLALAAISDPIRPEVPLAIEHCRQAGVNIKIITGDSTGTVLEIARQIGLWTEKDDKRNCIKGSDFANLTDEEALEVIGDLKVMSRARPLDKQRLVRLLQKKGEVVAVTGDGTNDAPALNYAQVGLSMGSGTSVAKEASDITLLDDSFGSIATAIMWGRSLYRNIQRFVMFQLTINFTALLIVLIGAFLDTPLPLTVTQMLWVNIIMDTFAALALASLPAEPEVMKDKPRPVNQFILTSPLRTSILGYGIAFVATLLTLLLHAVRTENKFDIRELTIFFTFFVMLQWWNLLNAKALFTQESAFRHLHKCYGLLAVAALILIGQFLIVQFGGAVFRTVPLSPIQWSLIIAFSSMVLWTGEGIRLFKKIHIKKT